MGTKNNSKKRVEMSPCAGRKKDPRISSLSPFSRFIKRSIDILVCLVAFVVFFPVFLIICIAIKLDDGGIVIFRQERIGKHGKPFILYKFRTMTEEAESDDTPQLYVEGDERLTRVGRFLREHHLDEFPQLWNVLIGQMSVVGYRPERMFYINQIVAINPDYELLYHTRPGLFSEATLYNGYTLTIDDMLRRLDMDLKYLYNRSLWLDLKIIFLTTVFILTGKKF
jgi:lipopolysaccharide/colanic/teichoic acid biosynthesis glycosyltransferase